jgi:hypothetical protein
MAATTATPSTRQLEDGRKRPLCGLIRPHETDVQHEAQRRRM